MNGPDVRRFRGDTLVLASHNAGKLDELRRSLGNRVARVLGAGDLDLPLPDEPHDRFEANAAHKARLASQAAGLPALADDSGLEIIALGGKPGVHTADWATTEEGRRDDALGIRRIEAALAGHADRTARFRCVLALAWPDGHVETAQGQIDGTLVFPPRGTGGFGYDPVFTPEGEARSFAQMTADQKAQYSHRARALRAMLERCF